jgi:hypothetical protein
MPANKASPTIRADQVLAAMAVSNTIGIRFDFRRTSSA